MFSLRLDDDLAARFDAAAAACGGRSARLRQLIEADTGVAGSPAARRSPSAARLTVRLDPRTAAHVAEAAAAMSMSRPAWLAALAGHHADGRPRFPASQDDALLTIRGEVRRIGVNVNQIARALNTAVMEGRVLELELASVEDLRRELGAHMAGLGEAFAGNLAYWSVAA